jgi:general secretion pathway protein G
MNSFSKQEKSLAFTLLELLVVIAIIGLLATIVLASLNTAKEKALVSTAVRQIKEIEKAVLMYQIDTFRLPNNCENTCASSPLNENGGEAGWAGPYLSVDLKFFAHPWGGHYSIQQYDSNSDGKLEMIILLNDDAPQTLSTDNSGPVPVSVLLAIDNVIDDGDLSTGRFVGHGNLGAALYEGYYITSM